MTTAEYQVEHRHIFETRLAILGADALPTADQHNMAAIEADRHIAALKAQAKREAIGGLRELRDSL